MQLNKEIVLLYFQNGASMEEDRIVEEWLSSSPENTQQAMKWLDDLSDEEEKLFLKIVLSGKDVWEGTVSKTNLNQTEYTEKTKSRFRLRNIYLHANRYAATLVSILMLAFAFYLYRIYSVVEVKTSYGTTKEIILPDGSNVILNGNSSLRYKYSWEKGAREVWLEGEAFFKVKHKKDHSEFKVYLSGEKIIEVLGTEFNVSDRSLKSSIFLKSGKISLHLPNSQKHENIFLEPGQSLDLDESSLQKNLPVQAVNPEKYYGWTKQKWVLDKTSLKEILLRLEENHGVHVYVEHDDLLKREISGSIPLSTSESTDVLINDIAGIFQLQVSRAGEKIILSQKN